MSSGGDGGTGSSGGPVPDASTGKNPDPYSGPFKVLVLSKTLGFHHDSIPACQQMLRELGRCTDEASCGVAGAGDQPIAGAKPNSGFTVDVAGAPSGCMELPTQMKAQSSDYSNYAAMGCDGSTSDLSQFSASNLDTNQFSTSGAPQGPYQLIFFCSPTGTVFSSGGANGQAGMTAIQNFITAGGGYGGLHAATDFENQNGFPWYTNELVGAYFTEHNNDGTAGTVNTVPNVNSPVMQGIPNPWNTQDEWYLENREISSQPGFQILATLSGVPALTGEAPNDIRPIVWTKQFASPPSDPTMTLSGRSFYTCRGHNIARFGEAPFRQLIHQGVLWAAHRLN